MNLRRLVCNHMAAKAVHLVLMLGRTQFPKSRSLRLAPRSLGFGPVTRSRSLHGNQVRHALPLFPFEKRLRKRERSRALGRVVRRPERVRWVVVLERKHLERHLTARTAGR